jgi:hypothetical protein
MSKSPLQPIKDNSEMNSVQSIINGSNCLLPVSENEDMQIKAALVNLRKLKLDIEIKQDNGGGGNVGGGGRMSQKEQKGQPYGG